MKNNYDLILNFEKKNGDSLSEKEVTDILDQTRYLVILIEHYADVKVWKTIISQAVDSRGF